MSNAEMLNYQLDKFREVMEQYKNKRGTRIVFIHGKGEGVLRKAVLDELKRKYPACSAKMLLSGSMASRYPGDD